MNKSLVRKISVTAICLLATCCIALYAQSDTTIFVRFPDIQKTNYFFATGKFPTTLCSITFRKGIETRSKVPSILWIDGGFGGAGDCSSRFKEKIGNDDYILINFPLFKHSIDSLQADSSNAWSRFRIRISDSEAIWQAYKVMLDSIFTRFPQIDRSNSFMGGFSNGAHCTAVLLNRPNAEITQYFSKFFFIEGGDGLQYCDILKDRPTLFMQGTELSYPNWVKSFYDNAKHCKSKAKFIFMKGVGHEFPKSYYKKFSCWIRKNTKAN